MTHAKATGNINKLMRQTLIHQHYNLTQVS